MKWKQKDEDFSKDKKIFDFSNYVTKSKFYDNSNKLVVGKMKDETAGFPIKEFVGLKPKMYSFLVDDSSEHKKAKDVNRNVVGKITHNEYKDVLLNKKCLRHMMNRIQRKNHRIWTKINKLYHVLMIKYTSKAMDMMDQVLVFRVKL